MVIVVLVIVAALLIHSCDVSQANNSLKTYAGNVSSLVDASSGNGAKMFKDLRSGKATSNPAGLQYDLNTFAQTASRQLQETEGLSTPGAMQSAQQSFVEVMRLRYDGIEVIAAHIQGAMDRNTAVDDVKQITAGSSMLYASDVLYKASVAPAIAAALNAASLPIGGTTGVTISSAQVVPDLGWLNSKTVALWLGATVPSTSVNSDAPGLHGHSLNSVTVNGVALSTTSLNQLKSDPAPTFTLNLTNGGSFPEYDVACRVSIKNVKDSAQSVITETTPGQTTSCNVTLPSPPPKGPYVVTAEVVPVPGEKNKANNFLTFNVEFS